MLANAYPGFGSPTREVVKRRTEMFRVTLRDKRKNAYGAFHGDELIGAMFLFDYMMNFHGATVLSGGLGGVGVDLTHKKEHVALNLVKYYLKHYIEREAPLAVLWPFRADFYRDMGFGHGARSYQYRLDPKSLPKGSKKDVRFLTADDIPAVNDCYNEFSSCRTGMIEETVANWQNRFELRETEQFVGCVQKGVLKAFLVFEFEKGKSTNPLDNHMNVHQIIYNDPAALFQLLEFLRAQADQISQVNIHTDEDEFYFALNDYRWEKAGTFLPIYQDSHMAGVGIMYRILSLKKAFEALTDYSFGDYSGAVRLELKDNLVKENGKPVTVDFEQGQPKIIKKNTAAPVLSMNIAEFSSLMMGAISLQRLVDYGLAEISDKKLLPQLDKLFSFPHKPLTVTSF